MESDMLQMFRTMEGKNLVSGKKTLTADDRKALETLKRTTYHKVFVMRSDYLGKMTLSYRTTTFLPKHNYSHLKTNFNMNQTYFVVTTKPSKQTLKKDLLERHNVNSTS